MVEIANLESLPPGTRIPLPAYARRWGRSMRTIDRWIGDPATEFPPVLYIRGRRYVTAGDALKWERRLPDLLATNKRPSGGALVRSKISKVAAKLKPRAIRDP
jgi:hypothetical protein